MERVHLRQLCENDRELYGLAYREEPENETANEELIELMFQTCLSHPEDEMAILLGDNNEWCGYCSVFYKENDIPELGINLLPAYQGRGIGAAAIRQLITYVRKDHNMSKFSLKMTRENIRCRRMCEKLGAKFEGEVIHPMDQMFKNFEEELGAEAFQKAVKGISLKFNPVLRYVIDINELF